MGATCQTGCRSEKTAFLAREMIINSAQCHTSTLTDLPHGSGVVTLLQEQGMGGIHDILSRNFTLFAGTAGGHGILLINNERPLFYRANLPACQYPGINLRVQ